MSTPDTDSEELVRQASRGDQAAVAELLQRHRGRLRQMVRMRMDPRIRGRLDPSDVIQETFMTASQQLPQYLQTRPLPFYLWLRRIAWQKLGHAHEQHLDAKKRTIRREQSYSWGTSDHSAMQIAKVIAAGLTSPSAAAVQKETRERVRAALDELPETDREILLQRYVEQLSIKEIATVLESTDAAVYKRHTRALQKVHRALRGDRP
jgi:RNA polymerase sigma-70 factor, ECF subfamily